MRTTITLPNDLAADAMREGYRREAENPSLDEEWSAIETEGWP